MQHDAVELGIGYPRLSPERDMSGRALLIFNQKVVERKNAYDRNGMRRALYYRIHLALRDIQVQRSGFVLIGLGYGQIDQLDRKLDVSLWRTIRDVLPARIVASHFVYGSNKHMKPVKTFESAAAAIWPCGYSGGRATRLGPRPGGHSGDGEAPLRRSHVPNPTRSSLPRRSASPKKKLDVPGGPSEGQQSIPGKKIRNPAIRGKVNLLKNIRFGLNRPTFREEL